MNRPKDFVRTCKNCGDAMPVKAGRIPLCPSCQRIGKFGMFLGWFAGGVIMAMVRIISKMFE